MVRKRSERGFTLIELLVVTTMLGVLAILAFPNYTKLRQRGYHSSVSSHVRNIKTALEAGRGLLAERGPQYYARSVDVSGPVLDENGIDFLPGIVNPENTEVTVYSDGLCEAGLLGSDCPIDGGQVFSCRGGVTIGWTTFRNGITTSWDLLAEPSC